jgi:beta-aspartyl-dipeptidase (metallo-type)
MSNILLKNVRLYAPESLGVTDILMIGDKVAQIGTNLEPVLGAEVIDASDLIGTPGLIDQHIHVNGGGGEGGPVTRTPEVQLSELIRCGITSLVGVCGTDNVSRSVENLLAKVRALNTEGVSAWMYTSNYAYPPTLLSQTVRKDLFLVPEVLGVKLALGDHRSSFPTVQEVLRLLSEIRVGGMISGKTGLLHIHMGSLKSGFETIFEVVKAGMPIVHIRPTHVCRTKDIMDQGIEFAKMGGRVDLTSGGSPDFATTADSVIYALDHGVPLSQLTLSSDGHGSMPVFDDKGNMIGLGVGGFEANFEEVKTLMAKGMSASDALSLLTSNVAKGLDLPSKGCVKVGGSADLCLFTPDWELRSVIARGKVLMLNGELKAKGTFE